jgi:D-3-phosphoglycerate dehydrogenase
VALFGAGTVAGFLADKDALFVRLAHRIDEEFLSAAPYLQFLCSPTTGLTHINLDALARRRIRLLSLKGETAFLQGIRATPEHALGLLLALLRKYRTAFLDERNAHWDRDRCRGEELYGTPVGIIGFGRVGQCVAAYLRGFGAETGWYDPFVADAIPGTTRHASLGALIESSRALILSASYEPGTPPIVDAAAVAALAGKYFVNVARGELVDDDALLASAERGMLAGCAVDVITHEHDPERRKRWIAATRNLNVIVTPHIAGATSHSMRATEEFLAEKLAVAIGGQQGTHDKVYL